MKPPRPCALARAAAAAAVVGIACALAIPGAPVSAHDGDHRGQTLLDHALTIAVDIGALAVLALPVGVLLALRPVGPRLRVVLTLACLVLAAWGAVHAVEHMLAIADRPDQAADPVRWQTAVAAAGVGLTGLVALAFGRKR